MNNIKLEIILNKYLKNYNIKDKCINGLQIGGEKIINKIITSVTFNKNIIKKIKLNNYNSVIVHHGLIWKNKNKLNIKKKNIINFLLKNKINLFAWHIPLDIHKKIGNNITLSKKLKIKIKKLPTYKNPFIIGYNYKNIKKKIKKNFKKFKYIKSKKYNINKICICCGNGNKYLKKSIIKYKIDTFITGEISKKKKKIIKKKKLNLLILGHDLSEQFGIKKLNKFINKKLNIKTYYLNINK